MEMDLIEEAMLEAGYDGRVRPPAARELIAELIAGALLIPACAALAVLVGGGHFAAPWIVVALVAGYALVARVNFDVGAGHTCPVELLLVPMLFAAPPAAVPLLVALGFVASRLLDLALTRGGQPLRVASALPDAWHAFGPALVLGLFHVTSPDLVHWPVFVLAFLAQVVFDTTAGTAREWAIMGIAPRLQARVIVGVAFVDAALAPIGLLLAVVMVHQPAAIVCVFPLGGLLAVFSRERDQRIRQALQLSSTYRGTALLMGDVLEADDAYTGGEHTQGVVALALAVGDELGLDAYALRSLEFGSLLHDVGKLRISNEIINKPGKLTPAEWEIIRRHPIDGQQMLARVGGVLADVGDIVRAHHERVDGGGYPDGLLGDEIPIASRIICACDAYSAMTTTRSYRQAGSRASAIAELRRCAGTQFDAEVVEALARITERAVVVAADLLPAIAA